MSSEWQWFGQAGHFVSAARCRFHLHTHVGNWCISTVGDCFNGADVHGPPREIGADRLYETMVFELDEKCVPKDWNGVDFAAYNDRDAANAGHLAMCMKYETHEQRVARLQAALVEADKAGGAPVGYQPAGQGA